MKIYAYCTTSNDPVSGQDLAAQEAAIRAFCKLHNHELVEVFQDPTGKSFVQVLTQKEEQGIEGIALFKQGKVMLYGVPAERPVPPMDIDPALAQFLDRNTSA